MTLASPFATTTGARSGAPPIDAATPARLRNGHLLGVGSSIFLIPNVVFALHLQPAPAVAMLTGAGLTLFLTWQGGASSHDALLTRPVALPRLAFLFLSSLALLVLGGEGHIMFANWDWLWRDSVLADLARGSFPPRYHLASGDFFLRAPLGMYMLPSLAARAIALGVGHAVLLFQNALLLTLVLYMLASLTTRSAWLVILVFLSFSGLDIVGELVMWVLRGHDVSSFVLPSHIENWSGLQYSSVITQLFWVPNHALPSYWLVILVLLCAKGELGFETVVVGLATSLFWSPFAFIGALPFAVHLFLREVRTIGLRPRFWMAVAAALGFLPVALYMLVDAAQVPHEFILFQPFAFAVIALFLVIEIPHFAIVREAWRDLDPMLRGLVAVALASLVALPTVRVGSSGDLVMRGSIPALVVLAFAFAQSLDLAWTRKRFVLLGAGLVIVAVGAVTPAQEVIRSLTFPSFAISDCSIVTVWKTMWADHPTIENYLARQTRLLGWLLQTAEGAPIESRSDVACWPQIPYPPRSDISNLSNAMLLRLGEEAKKAKR